MVVELGIGHHVEENLDWDLDLALHENANSAAVSAGVNLDALVSPLANPAVRFKVGGKVKHFLIAMFDVLNKLPGLFSLLLADVQVSIVELGLLDF